MPGWLDEDIRYWLDEVQLYVMLHRPLHSTILKKDQIIFKTGFEDTFALKSHLEKTTKALSIIKTKTRNEDVVGLRESWALLKRKSFCQKPSVRAKRQNSFL